MNSFQAILVAAIFKLSLLLASGVADAETLPVTSGPALDYQPSVIRSTDDDARIVVFERLNASTLFGDLWLTRSLDGGASWSAPVAIIASASNERHAALLQLATSSYVLFYLKGASAAASFRIFRATSDDGVNFSEQGMAALGWPTGGEINPHVIRHADGTLTMSYQRLTADGAFSAGAYVAQSNDGGATWDTQRTQINAGGLLPRIVFRESDGLYLASYQTNPGNNDLQMRVKTTTDVRDWSAAAQDFAITGNNHDSLPIVMADGAIALFWIRASGSQFDILVRRSIDGVNWQPARALTATPDEDDVEPHPLAGASPGVVELYWGRDQPAGSNTYDIVRDPAAVVLDAVFADDFDGA